MCAELNQELLKSYKFEVRSLINFHFLKYSIFGEDFKSGEFYEDLENLQKKYLNVFKQDLLLLNKNFKNNFTDKQLDIFIDLLLKEIYFDIVNDDEYEFEDENEEDNKDDEDDKDEFEDKDDEFDEFNNDDEFENNKDEDVIKTNKKKVKFINIDSKNEIRR